MLSPNAVASERRRLYDLLEPARQICREAYGTPQYEDRFNEVRAITSALADLPSTEEFCSVDSGVHRTRLSSGRII